MITAITNRLLVFKKWTVFLLVIWIILIFNSPLPGKIDGKLFPVISDFNFTVEEYPNNDHASIVYGELYKRRNCSYIDIDWYITSINGLTTKTHVEYLEKEVVRQKGEHLFGPWKINVPANEIRDSIFVNVRHQCYIFNNNLLKVEVPWITTTKVYP